MSTTPILVLLAVLLVAAVVVTFVVARKRRRRAQLRETFGQEYDRTVETSGKRRDAERALAERQQRHETLDIRPLPAASRARYLTAWDGLQTRFVDSPVLALTEADQLVTRVMAERGYPTDATQTQEEMLSVEHAGILESFRAGHAIEQANRSDSSDTEQVRQGMLHFRTVFEALLEDDRDSEPYPAEDATRTRTEVRETR